MIIYSFLGATTYAHHVFRAFDVESTGAINFRVRTYEVDICLKIWPQDLLLSLSTLLHGTLYEKLMWTFRMYDLDGDGVITKVELGNVVVGVYELMGIILLPPVSLFEAWIWSFYPPLFSRRILCVTWTTCLRGENQLLWTCQVKAPGPPLTS